MPVEQVPIPDYNEPTFADYAASMPETAAGFLVDDAPPLVVDEGAEIPGGVIGAEDAAPTAQERKTKRIKMSRKMQKSMDKFKAKTAKFPVLWFHNKAKDNPEWELDKDEEELLTDAIETVFEILDIEIQIEPLTMTLTSIWWVISYPILAFAFLFLTKQSSIQQKAEQQTTESTQ